MILCCVSVFGLNNKGVMPSSQEILLQRKAKASELLQRIEKLSHLNGIRKLKIRVIAENDFLLSLERNCFQASESHLKSSNLSFLEAILTTGEYSKNVMNFLKRFFYSWGDNQTAEVMVDVVAQGGKLWFKCFARNPYALHRIWEGSGQHGEKDVCKLACEYQNAAKQNVVDFVLPKIVFLFAAGVTKSVVEDLEKMDIRVVGKRMDDPCDIEETTRNDSFDLNQWCIKTHLASLKMNDLKHNNKVNLDVTTLIALVSSVTNTQYYVEFEDEILNSQTEQEHIEPLLPILYSFLQGKDLYVCKTALNDFQNILATIGGTKEIERAKELLAKLNIVDDCPSEQALQLAGTARINKRSKIIFGSGDTLHATTLTANKSFVRAAHNQGVNFSVFLHSSRALTEKKEKRITAHRKFEFPMT